MTKGHNENQPGRDQKDVNLLTDQPQNKDKHAGGRPPKYKTAAELQVKIDEYFSVGVSKRIVLTGPPNNRRESFIPVPTICGLVAYCGFADRHSFYALEKLKEFSHTMKQARNRIEQNYEELLQTGAATGAIFALKNFGWIDTPAIDQSIHYHLTYGYRSKPVNSAIRAEGRQSQLTKSNPETRS